LLDKIAIFISRNEHAPASRASITELVTGIDIVKEQLRIARASAELSAKNVQQAAVNRMSHHAETRTTAFSFTGKIISLHEPTDLACDSKALVRRIRMSLYYDPLIENCVCGARRATAIMRMKRALGEYKILGVSTSIPFHQKLFQSTTLSVEVSIRIFDERFSMEQGTSMNVSASPIMPAPHARSRQHALNIHRQRRARAVMETVWRAGGLR